MFLDKDARHDGTDRRPSTVENAFPRLRLLTGRQDLAGRDEQYERLYLLLVDATPFGARYECFAADDPSKQISLECALDEIVELVAERNFDTYLAEEGMIRRV